tara:strand:+ start:86 stop:541 length:456 start_codon:yes stop_codon:yes gene_type:complete
MEALAYVYIIVYFIYVIFSDNIFTKLIFNEDIKFPPDITEIIKRSLFISYISLILIAIFFLNKSKFTWNLAFMVSLFSLVTFVICNLISGRQIKFPPEDGNYSVTGTIMHSLIIIPLLFYPEYFNFSVDINLVLGLGFYLLFAYVFQIYVY